MRKTKSNLGEKIVALATLLTMVSLSIFGFTNSKAEAAYNFGEVFTVLVTDNNGSGAVVKGTRNIPVGKTFNIGKMKKEVGQGDALLVTRFKSSKGKYTYNYKPTNTRVEFGFVKDSKTLVNSNGKKIKYSSKLTPGSYVQITYDTKLTYEHTDDTVKKVTVIGTYK